MHPTQASTSTHIATPPPQTASCCRPAPPPPGIATICWHLRRRARVRPWRPLRYIVRDGEGPRAQQVAPHRLPDAQHSTPTVGPLRTRSAGTPFRRTRRGDFQRSTWYQQPQTERALARKYACFLMLLIESRRRQRRQAGGGGTQGPARRQEGGPGVLLLQKGGHQPRVLSVRRRVELRRRDRRVRRACPPPPPRPPLASGPFP